MRAVTISRPGGVEVLEVRERPVREPAADEVRVAVRAAAVNPTDIGLRRGGADGLDPPWIPGMDLAGVVESVGDGVERLSVGDEVMAAVTPRRPEGGAQAELVIVPEASAVAVPDGATMAQAATLPMNGLTALRGLDLLGLPAGATLAVTGGAGLLASYVIPLARTRGLRTIADAAPADEALVRGYGADDIVPRGGGFPAAVRELHADGVDGVFDTALLRRTALPVLRDGGGMAVVRGWDSDPVERDIRIHTVRVAEVLNRTDWLEELRERAARGGLQLRVAAEYPPERAAEAHELMDAGGIRGRAVIVFAG